jgi:ABC-type uncharacterized transport system auxiliary subunit
MIRKTLALLVLALCAGCLSPNEVTLTRYYVLEPEPPAPPASSQPLPVTLGVRHLDSARPFKVPMVYRTQDEMLEFRLQESWTEAPSDVLTRALIDALVDSHRFADTGRSEEMARPDYQLTGEVRKCYENRAHTPATADLEIRIVVREARGAEKILDQVFSASVPMQEDTAPALARAMSQAATTVIQDATTAVVSAEGYETTTE